MKITFERDANGEILSLETITEKEGILSDGERAKLQTYLMQKDISEDQKEIIVYILEDKDPQNMLDIKKIQAIKKLFEDK